MLESYTPNITEAITMASVMFPQCKKHIIKSSSDRDVMALTTLYLKEIHSGVLFERIDPTWMLRHRIHKESFVGKALEEKIARALVNWFRGHQQSIALDRFLYNPDYRTSAFLLYANFDNRNDLFKELSSIVDIHKYPPMYAVGAIDCLEWYKLHQKGLAAFNYGTFTISPISNMSKFILGFLDFSNKAGEINVSIGSPAWNKYWEHLEENYSVSLGESVDTIKKPCDSVYKEPVKTPEPLFGFFRR